LSRPAKPPADDSRAEGVELWKTPAGRLALRLDELAKALGISRRTLERERSAGRFPRPDLTIVKMPLWRVETIRDWLASGGSEGR
jgi:predicted DNA-binding transcriptional regulator AlpA